MPEWPRTQVCVGELLGKATLKVSVLFKDFTAAL